MCVRMTLVKLFLKQATHSSHDQKSKCPIYVYHWMRLIRLRMKILAASDT